MSNIQHIGKVRSIANTFFLCIVRRGLELWKRCQRGGEVGLVEVGEGEALCGVQPNLVRRRGQL